MSSYYIYAGLKSKFGPPFQYIKHNTTKDDALIEAENLAIEIFEDSEEFGELWDKCFDEAMDSIKKEEDFTDELYNALVYSKTNKLYEERIDEFISYDVTLYEK